MSTTGRQAPTAGHQNPPGTSICGEKETPKAQTSKSDDDLSARRIAPAADDWQNPMPLGGELPPVPSFDLLLLPESLRPLVEDTTERMQVCLDFPAVAAVLCLAGATNRRVRFQPKAADTSWVVTPNLWGGIIAAPGLMKSPVISTIAQPLTGIESDWRAEYESAMKTCEQSKEEAELRQSAWREQYKASAKNGKSAPPRPVNETAVPQERRLITQDATFECLHQVMADNPAGMFVIRDELTGWLASLERQGREGERAFYLSAWNGDTPHTVDRIGRGSVHVDACCVSILGGIQPARLRAYLVDALKDGPANDGLMQRFQVLVYPDTAGDWKYVDRAPNSTALSRAEQTYRRLVNVDVSDSVLLQFTSEAQALFIEWLTELESKVRDESLHPALVSHFAKYRKLMPSLALLFALADGPADAVSLSHARQSAAFCDYLDAHARRIYSMLVSPERLAAAELGRHLANGWKRAERLFTVREVYQNDWSGLSTPENVRRAINILEDAGWVRLADQRPSSGRPSEIYLVNPRLTRRMK